MPEKRYPTVGLLSLHPGPLTALYRAGVARPVQPILVCMVWRGGERFERCLTSIAESIHHFQRVILSITAPETSPDMEKARAFQREHPAVEVICTGEELPTMPHQAFWVDYLENTHASPDDWIYWLAYDDQVRHQGIDTIVDEDGNWPIDQRTVYIGPWAMRHESADTLWQGEESDEMESWTSFPMNGPTRLPLLTWIRDQLRQPTYMQMSGSVMPFANYLELRDGRPRKQGPMRIEMATAAGESTTHVQEFDEPISTIYGRSNSDRATYGRAARKEDVHLIAWLARWTARNPSQATELAGIVADQARTRLTRTPPPNEEWRVRGTVK